jgi:hypothetical protein
VSRFRLIAITAVIVAGAVQVLVTDLSTGGWVRALLCGVALPGIMLFEWLTRRRDEQAREHLDQLAYVLMLAMTAIAWW